MPKPKEIIRDGMDRGRIREHLQETTMQNGVNGSIEEYGGDKLEKGAQYVSEKATHAIEDMGGRIKDKAYEKLRDRIIDDSPKEKTEWEGRRASAGSEQHERTTNQGERPFGVKEKPSAKADTVKTKERYIHSEFETAAKKGKMAPNRGYGQSVKRGTKKTAEMAKNSAKKVGKGSVKTARRAAVKTAKNSVKAAKAGVKTAERTARVTIKTAKTTARVTQKAVQVAVRAARIAAQTAVKVAQLAAKAAIAAAKAIAAAVKALIVAVAAGGWVAVVIILVVALVALILCACFGVFASNETEDDSKPMTEAIQTIDAEFKDGIDTKIAELSVGEYDEIVVEYAGDMDGDSPYILNWNDVIAVYSVAVTMDVENPTDVAELTPEKVEQLREIFYDMNTASYSTRVEKVSSSAPPETTEQEETPSHTALIITVDVQSMDYYAAAEMYDFDDTQIEALEAMMESRMLPLYAELTGVDLYGGSSPEDLTEIISGLPPGEKGTQIVNAALKRIGDPYSQPKRGSGRYVDCSYLSWWAYREAGISIPNTSVEQAKWCYENGYAVGESELMPGDLIFWTKTSCRCGRWNEIHHVGIYIGDGRCIEASSGKGRVVVREIWEGSGYELFLYARPK